MKSTSEAPAARPAEARQSLLTFETPFGRPVGWAEVALVTDRGDSHELNDDRCLIVTSKDLGESRPGPLGDFMLCLLADGATGSTFSPRAAANYGGDSPKQAGWRASQLAQAVFVERFLGSLEVDILDRLKDGLRAADQALLDSREGTLSSTLVALFVAADGTAYAASIGDSAMLVLPPQRGTPGDRRLKKLGYEESTSVGSGDTTVESIDEAQLIEQWWPHKEAASGNTRLDPGTFLVLLSDGISDNLPAAAIDQLLRRHPLARATVALPAQTRARRIEAQKSGGGSTQQLGLDNMSAIAVRFDGQRGAGRTRRASRGEAATLICVHGTHGGPMPDADGHFGLICLAAQERGSTVAAPFLRALIESEHLGGMSERMEQAFRQATAEYGPARLAALGTDEYGASHVLAGGGTDIRPAA